MTIYLLVGTVATSLLFVSIFIIRFLAGGNKYLLKDDVEYEKLTMGNPLNAFFVSRLLTGDGLALRGVMLRSLAILWGAYLIAATAIGLICPTPV